MDEITFLVTRDGESGGYCASWEDPSGGGIATQGDDLAELQEMIRDAVDGYFEEENQRPKTVRLHFPADGIWSAAA